MRVILALQSRMHAKLIQLYHLPNFEISNVTFALSNWLRYVKADSVSLPTQEVVWQESFRPNSTWSGRTVNMVVLHSTISKRVSQGG